DTTDRGIRTVSHRSPPFVTATWSLILAAAGACPQVSGFINGINSLLDRIETRSPNHIARAPTCGAVPHLWSIIHNVERNAQEMYPGPRARAENLMART